MKQKQLSRRRFLKNTLLGSCAAYAALNIRPFTTNLAHAADPFGPQKVLIVINFGGGVSYNIAPPLNSVYLDRNPNIGLRPEEALVVHPSQGLHSSLVTLKQLFDDGDLAVINMLGYPNPNRSHAESTIIKMRGIRENSFGVSSGWGARLTCQMSSAFAGISLSGSNAMVAGDCNPPRSLGGLDSLGLKYWGSTNDQRWREITDRNLRADADDPQNMSQALVKESFDGIDATLATLQKQTDIELPVAFPNTSFGRSCRDAAKLIAATSLGTQFIYLATGGYDTHSGERGRLAASLAEVDAGLAALVETVKGLGRWNDVVITTLSEFCRTHENGSQGSDHGHAGPGFVMGGSVKGGVKSEPPTAAESSVGSYFASYNVDYRLPFIEIVRDFLGKDSSAVFPEPISAGNGSLGLFV